MSWWMKMEAVGRNYSSTREISWEGQRSWQYRENGRCDYCVDAVGLKVEKVIWQYSVQYIQLILTRVFIFITVLMLKRVLCWINHSQVFYLTHFICVRVFWFMSALIIYSMWTCTQLSWRLWIYFGTSWAGFRSSRVYEFWSGRENGGTWRLVCCRLPWFYFLAFNYLRKQTYLPKINEQNEMRFLMINFLKKISYSWKMITHNFKTFYTIINWWN